MERNQQTVSNETPAGQAGSSLFPESIDEKMQQACELHGQNRLDEAAAIYQEVLTAMPANIFAGFNLGMIHLNRREYPEAVSCYEKVLQQEPDNFQTLCCLGNARQELGCWNEAIWCYRKAVELKPDHAASWYSLGLAYHFQNEFELALNSYMQAVDLDPSHAAALYNQGLIHYHQKNFSEAVACYLKALDEQPKDFDIVYNLAVTYMDSGEFVAAADYYRLGLDLAPENATLHNGLGAALKQLQEFKLAIACFHEAIRLKPDYGAAYTNLAIVNQLLKNNEEAISCYQRAIELGHEVESAEHMLAALTGKERETAPRKYIQNLFNSYADTFEQSLVENLDYALPRLCKETILDLPNICLPIQRGADLGCGTGLVGEQLQGLVTDFTGVDIAEEMLAKAKEKKTYDAYHCAELLHFLDGCKKPFDLLLAADVLNYLGDLKPFFASVVDKTNVGGYLLFSVEKLTGNADYRLEPSGRYAHSLDYIKKMASTYGFHTETCREIKVRKERERWLKGFLFAMRKL